MSKSRKKRNSDIEHRRNNRRKQDMIFIAGILIILISLVSGYFWIASTPEDNEDNAGNDLKIEPSSENDRISEGGNNNIKEIKITAEQFEFAPNRITVEKGDRVKITIKSPDVAHGFAISGYNINEYIPGGEEVTVEFVANSVGNYQIFCSVQCGYGHGEMRGTFVVN
jgi:cytochrome c oxidase subunit 2